jgi:hypothetical protein
MCMCMRKKCISKMRPRNGGTAWSSFIDRPRAVNDFPPKFSNFADWKREEARCVLPFVDTLNKKTSKMWVWGWMGIAIQTTRSHTHTPYNSHPLTYFAQKSICTSPRCANVSKRCWNHLQIQPPMKKVHPFYVDVRLHRFTGGQQTVRLMLYALV